MSAKKILITGGAGFIGSALARSRSAGSGELAVLDNLHPQVHATCDWPADLPAKVRRHRRDVSSARDWDGLLARFAPDVVVHLAAETGTGQSMIQASRHGLVNVVGTTQMLDAFVRHGVHPEQIVLASSRAVYGEGRWRNYSGEDFYPAVRDIKQLSAGKWDPTPPEGMSGPVHPMAHNASSTEPRPASIYAATKLAQEHLLQSWCASSGARLAILRFQNVYGPGQSLTNPYTGIVALFAQIGLRRGTIELYEDARVIRDFVFVDDVVAAINGAIDLGVSTSVPLDIGSGDATTLWDLATTITAATGAPQPTVSGRFRTGDVRAAFADVKPAMTTLGWAPRVGLAEGLDRLLESIRESAE